MQACLQACYKSLLRCVSLILLPLQVLLFAVATAAYATCDAVAAVVSLLLL
jgi:hypothetical protein